MLTQVVLLRPFPCCVAERLKLNVLCVGPIDSIKEASVHDVTTWVQKYKRRVAKEDFKPPSTTALEDTFAHKVAAHNGLLFLLSDRGARSSSALSEAKELFHMFWSTLPKRAKMRKKIPKDDIDRQQEFVTRLLERTGLAEVKRTFSEAVTHVEENNPVLIHMRAAIDDARGHGAAASTGAGDAVAESATGAAPAVKLPAKATSAQLIVELMRKTLPFESFRYDAEAVYALSVVTRIASLGAAMPARTESGSLFHVFEAMGSGEYATAAAVYSAIVDMAYVIINGDICDTARGELEFVPSKKRTNSTDDTAAPAIRKVDTQAVSRGNREIAYAVCEEAKHRNVRKGKVGWDMIKMAKCAMDSFQSRTLATAERNYEQLCVSTTFENGYLSVFATTQQFEGITTVTDLAVVNFNDVYDDGNDEHMWLCVFNGIATMVAAAQVVREQHVFDKYVATVGKASQAPPVPTPQADARKQISQSPIFFGEDAKRVQASAVSPAR